MCFYSTSSFVHCEFLYFKIFLLIMNFVYFAKAICFMFISVDITIVYFHKYVELWIKVIEQKKTISYEK
jgi:hypothetical protein